MSQGVYVLGGNSPPKCPECTWPRGLCPRTSWDIII